VELSKSWDGKEEQVREGAGASGTDNRSRRVEPLCFVVYTDYTTSDSQCRSFRS